MCNVIILGSPGGGKGTICKKLLKNFEFTHVSTGDLLRSHISGQTTLGLKAEKYINEGKLVPDDLVIGLIQQLKTDKSLLLDGFPRTLHQAFSLGNVMTIDSVIALDIPHETIINRLSNRWVHAPSGRTYANDYNPPKVSGIDDVTGEKLTQREDDKPDTIRTRLENYQKQTAPLIEYYKNNTNVHFQIFSGTESDVIYPEVADFLHSRFAV